MYECMHVCLGVHVCLCICMYMCMYFVNYLGCLLSSRMSQWFESTLTGKLLRYFDHFSCLFWNFLQCHRFSKVKLNLFPACQEWAAALFLSWKRKDMKMHSDDGQVLLISWNQENSLGRCLQRALSRRPLLAHHRQGLEASPYIFCSCKHFPAFSHV